MKCNLGQVEKTVRALLGFPLAIAGLFVKEYSILWGQLLLGFGLWLLITAAFSWCPATWIRQTVSKKPDTTQTPPYPAP